MRVSGNLAGDGGGISVGIGVEESMWFEARHMTVTGNRAEDEGGGMLLGVYNSGYECARAIVWGNGAAYGAEAFYVGSGGVVFDSCEVDTTGLDSWGGWAPVVHSISEDPLFCSPADCAGAPTDQGDYHLDAASPCLPAQTGG